MEILIKKIIELGANKTAIVNVSDIPFAPELLDLCKMNTCGNYMKSWTCPPLAGEIDELIATAKGYNKMLVFQAVYTLTDSFDIEGMFEANQNFRRLTEKVDEVCKTDGCKQYIVLSAGGCDICKPCKAATNEPCINPDKAFIPLEAYGIFVSKLAEVCGIAYINGVNTVTYFGGVLFD